MPDKSRSISTDIAVIKEMISSAREDILSFKLKCDIYDKDIGNLRIEQASIKADSSNMAKFQVALSVILSAIAAYLGVMR